MKLYKKTISILGAGFLAASLPGCSESAEDLARKPALIDSLAVRSMARCDPAQAAVGTVPYDLRLRHMLEIVSSKALDTLLDRNVTICLDKRFPQTQRGLFDNRPYGVFYNGDQPVVSIRGDSGATGIALDKLASALRKNSFSHEEALVSRSFYCGRGCSTVGWENAADTFREHPGLQKPPLRRPAP